jgi:hypothetical protein
MRAQTKEHRFELRLFVLLAASVLAACAGDERRAPATLMDASPSREVPIELENVAAPAVLTTVRVVDVGDIEPGSRSASCVRQDWDSRPAGQIVERTGVASETVTFRDGSGLAVYGCDNSAGPREEERSWCGTAFGRLHDGRLRDPRLDMGGCTTEDGELVGFVWVEPRRDARYVVVEQPGYAEVYEAAGGLPIRVGTTSGVQIERSRASFDLSEHAVGGELLRKYRLEAAVAG